MTTFAILILFAIIPIQIVVAPSISPEEEIGGVSKSEVQNFLKKKEYTDQIYDMFKIAQDSTTEAKRKVLEYSKTKLPDDLKNFLANIANAPSDVYKQMEPMLNEMNKKTNELDEKLTSESLMYRMVAKPAWGIFSGLGYMGLGILGYSASTLGSLAQLFSNGAKESVIAYNDGKLPDGQTMQVFDTIENGVDKIKNWGNKMGEHAADKLQNGRIRRSATSKIPETETSDKDKDEGAERGETNHENARTTRMAGD